MLLQMGDQAHPAAAAAAATGAAAGAAAGGAAAAGTMWLPGWLVDPSEQQQLFRGDGERSI